MSRRWIAMGLALFFGVLGFHWLYLGRFRRGFLYAGLGLIGISLYLGVIDAIRFACLSDTEFRRRYAGGPTGRRRRSRLNRVRVPISAAIDDELDRLRRQWQVDVYDPGHLLHGAQAPRGSDDAPVINPATGLPMVGGIGGYDLSGHVYGTGFEDDTLMDWHRDDADARLQWHDLHRTLDDDPFKSWDS